MKYVHSDNIDWKVFDDESVLLNLSTGYYFRLNRLGSFIWPLIDGEHNVGDIVQKVVTNFNVSRRQAKTDIDAFLEQLQTEQLIRRI